MHYSPTILELCRNIPCAQCVQICVCVPPKFYHMCTHYFQAMPMCKFAHYSQNYAGIIGTSLLATCYRKQENIEKRAYEQRVREIEHSSFTPLSMSLTRGLGKASTVSYKRLVSTLPSKHDQPYSSIIAWIRCALTFCLYTHPSNVLEVIDLLVVMQLVPPIDPISSLSCHL